MISEFEKRFWWEMSWPFLVVFIPAVGFWIVSSYFEAKSFNQLTGAHATAWDAMWVELRVQEQTKDK